jgi:hypothetical protein
MTKNTASALLSLMKKKRALTHFLRDFIFIIMRVYQRKMALKSGKPKEAKAQLCVD